MCKVKLKSNEEH